MFVLENKTGTSLEKYYTGKNYIYQQQKHFVFSNNLKEAKKYKNYKNACKGKKCIWEWSCEEVEILDFDKI